MVTMRAVRPASRTVARVSLLALVLSAVLVAGVAASLRTDAARAAEEKLPSYRCCFRIDTLMTGRLDTVFDDVVLSAPQHTSWTFRNSELVTYSMTTAGPRIRRAWARKGGAWPRSDGPGISFGVGRVTRGTCDKEDSSRVWTDAPNLMSRYYRSPQRRNYVLVEPGRAVADIGMAADEACDETQHGVRTGPLDGLDIGGATSHLLAMPTQRQLTTRTHVKLHRRLVMGRDVDHEEDFSGPLPHDTTGFSLVEVCFTYVPPGRVKAEAARIRALVGHAPTPVSSLACR